MIFRISLAQGKNGMEKRYNWARERKERVKEKIVERSEEKKK